jgi:hypothetical protein
MNRRLAFAIFAAALLLSMIREWSAPVSCLFPGIHRGTPFTASSFY